MTRVRWAVVAIGIAAALGILTDTFLAFDAKPTRVIEVDCMAAISIKPDRAHTLVAKCAPGTLVPCAVHPLVGTGVKYMCDNSDVDEPEEEAE